MTLRGLTRQSSRGFETRTLTLHFQEGSGWITKCFTTWKGEDSGELKFSDSQWFSTQQECEKDLEKRQEQFNLLGFQ